MKTFKDLRLELHESKNFKIVSNSPNKHSVHHIVSGRVKPNPVGIFTTRDAAEREISRRGGNLQEDGAAPGGAAPAAGPPGSGSSSGSPTNNTMGIKPSIDNPPVFKTKYKTKNAKGVKDTANALRKMVTGVNVE